MAQRGLAGGDTEAPVKGGGELLQHFLFYFLAVSQWQQHSTVRVQEASCKPDISQSSSIRVKRAKTP